VLQIWFVPRLEIGVEIGIGLDLEIGLGIGIRLGSDGIPSGVSKLVVTSSSLEFPNL